MFVVNVVVAILAGYLLGALPMGYIVLKVLKRQDITEVGSGRTGGTNAMRAGGIGLGLLTAALDILKGYSATLLAQKLLPGVFWVHILAAAASVLGHNWSLWLYLWKRRFSAGAGTGPNVGAAMGFWPGVGLIAIPVVLFFVFVVGYASLASLVVALTVVIVFSVRAIWHGQPWEYIIYGVITMAGVIWALRPNIERLIKGTERRVGIFAKHIRSRKNRVSTENIQS
ncbi:MAG: glycerol-3-phosphate acyltransferase [Anaerolineales bacterium]|nr:glycerol-3-phosphate acyltransferase [Anaerolineales bacterium]